MSGEKEDPTDTTSRIVVNVNSLSFIVVFLSHLLVTGRCQTAKNGGEHFCLSINEKAPLFRMAPNRGGHFFDGGAGIRTPVRDKIDHSVYVRIPLIEVSSRWPVESPLLDKSSKFSPADGRRTGRLSRIFDTLKAASGGLLYGQVQQLLRVTQPLRGCCSHLKKVPKVLPGSEDLGTRPQLH